MGDLLSYLDNLLLIASSLAMVTIILYSYIYITLFIQPLKVATR